MPSGVTPGVLVAAVGALLTFLAAFLTWANVEVTSRIGQLVGGGTRSKSGLQGHHLGKETLVLALAALALTVLLTQPTSRSWGWIALAVFGGLIVILALIDMAATSDAADLRKTLANTPGCSQVVQCTGDRSAGIGAYLTIVGGVVVLIGALMHHGVFARIDLARLRARRSSTPAAAAPPAGAVPVEPAAEAPTAEAPTPEVPAAEVPAAEEPAASEPAADVPAAEAPTAEEPAASESAAEEPAATEAGESRPAGGETAGTGSPAT